jgi:osmotically-inducible protein OsmY
VDASKDIRAQVYEELRVDPLIDTDDIEVKVLDSDVLLNGTVPSQAQRSEAAVAVPEGIHASAREGSVVLTGSARSPSQRVAAERAVAGCAGVVSVINDIVISS